MTKNLLTLLIGSLIIIISPIASAQTTCTLQYDPVCGSDGTTYGNACTATAQGVTIEYAGTCKTGDTLDQALSMAYQFGITKYKTLADYRPETLVTREQIAKMMLQFAKAMDRDGESGEFVCEFTDMAITDPTLTNYILDACKQGMIKGWNSAFHPQENVSYAQAITMLMRVVSGVRTEGDQRWTPYELQALAQGYLTKPLSQPLDMITRGELIVWMNIIYTMSKQADTKYQIREIKDARVSCQGEAPQQCLQISRDGGEFELFYDKIDGFDYVPGYTYTIQVVGNKVDNPPADASNTDRSVVKLESYTSTTGKPESLPQQGCDWTLIDNSTLSLRGQTCESNDGLTISYDPDLPGVIISTKKAQITTQVPIIHMFEFLSSTGLQSLLFDTHNAMIKQGLVDVSAACIFSRNTAIVGSRIERYDFIPDAAMTSAVDCGVYGFSNGSNSYFVKPKDIFTTLIYINNDPKLNDFIDRPSLIIK